MSFIRTALSFDRSTPYTAIALSVIVDSWFSGVMWDGRGADSWFDICIKLSSYSSSIRNYLWDGN